ncbi:MAG: hypothetical protein ACAH83_17170 [Alphaproteobacteria bacterium]
MPPKKDFNEKAKTFLYSVSVRPKYSRKTDFTGDMNAAAKLIKELAEEEGCANKVKVSFDDGSLNKLGIFFMNAPEKFAAKVKKLDGVQYVEKPSDRKAVPAGKRTSGRRYR